MPLSIACWLDLLVNISLGGPRESLKVVQLLLLSASLLLAYGNVSVDLRWQSHWCGTLNGGLLSAYGKASWIWFRDIDVEPWTEVFSLHTGKRRGSESEPLMWNPERRSSLCIRESVTLDLSESEPLMTDPELGSRPDLFRPIFKISLYKKDSILTYVFFLR